MKSGKKDTSRKPPAEQPGASPDRAARRLSHKERSSRSACAAFSPVATPPRAKQLWQKDDLAKSWPQFFTSSSPIVVDGLCIAQLGGAKDGGIIAYDMTTGD